MRRQPRLAVVLAVGLALATAPIVAGVPPTFTTEARLGFAGGDDWEPAIAAGANGTHNCPNMGTAPSSTTSG